MKAALWVRAHGRVGVKVVSGDDRVCDACREAGLEVVGLGDVCFVGFG